MKQRTETPGRTGSENPRLILEWIFALSIGAMIYLVFRRGSSVAYAPWGSMARTAIQLGLAEFSGLAGKGIEPGERFLPLLLVLLSFVAAPTVFLFSWRKLRLGGTPQSFIATIFFVAAGAVTLSVFIPSIPDAVRFNSEANRIPESTTVQLAKIGLMSGLNEIGVDARSYSILNSAGGNGRKGFEGYSIPERLKGSGVFTFAVGSGGPGTLRLVGTSPAYEGSSIALDIDSATGRFSYEGAFKP
ncbi:MAG TPA: hypothetical protein VI215_02650 [Bacteroidota bacterium]|jgi:hypothetical protein